MISPKVQFWVSSPDNQYSNWFVHGLSWSAAIQMAAIVCAQPHTGRFWGPQRPSPRLAGRAHSGSLSTAWERSTERLLEEGLLQLGFEGWLGVGLAGKGILAEATALGDLRERGEILTHMYTIYKEESTFQVGVSGPPQQGRRWLPSFYSREEWDTEMLRRALQSTELVIGRARPTAGFS